MPTPSNEALLHPSLLDRLIHRSTYTTCPPEEDRLVVNAERHTPFPNLNSAAINTRPTAEQLNTLAQNSMGPIYQALLMSSSPASTTGTSSSQQHDSDGDSEASQDTAVSPAPVSPASIPKDSKIASVEDTHARQTSPTGASPLPQLPHTPDTVATRPIPKFTSSFLRPGSKFEGTQQSDRQVYNVQVEIKHVDMSESFICGYLRIEGLTPDHPTLTTYFEGEIIGNKYSFQTRRAEWGSNEKVDMQHWNRFPAWRPLAKDARKSGFSYKNFAERENIFMRWKEYFLVPDHRVRTISGASFEGFYYICFNQISGSVSGIYFHAKSEKFQQLELKHVDDRGCMGAMEFR